MSIILRSSLLIVALATCVIIPNQGLLQAGGRHCCCQTCRQPCGHCTCQTAQAVVQERDVVTTEYRNETVVETVPATTVENVVVDEGSYQTVWVPRLTTKAVARTTYQTRTACRSVPYQVTRRVSECCIQTAPSQAVRLTPTNSTAIGSFAVPRYASTLPYSNAPTFSGTYPTLASSPILPRSASSLPGGSSIASVPDSRYADPPVTPITPRAASGGSRFDGRTSDSRTADARSADRGPSMFVPAPSAAQVWRSVVR